MAKPIIENLCDSGVVDLQLSKDRMYVDAIGLSGLDVDYSMDKAEVKRLIDELTKLHDQMIVRE